MMACTWAGRISPCQRPITRPATALPNEFTTARHSDMNRSIPNTSITPDTGIRPIADTLVVSMTKPPPVTPAVPFDASSMTNSTITCCPMGRSIPRACAMKTVVSVR